MDTYLTLAPGPAAEGFYSEKRSKFYAFACPVDTAQEALARVAEYRQRYHDARHVCWAYALGADASEWRANDDGEPSGTAGRPILGQLRSRQLTGALVVVVRYYGGVNLGTGGLIVAYRTAAGDALDHAATVERTVEASVECRPSFAQTSAAMRVAKEAGARMTAQTYDADGSHIVFAVRASAAPALRQRLAEVLRIKS